MDSKDEINSTNPSPDGESDPNHEESPNQEENPSHEARPSSQMNLNEVEGLEFDEIQLVYTLSTRTLRKANIRELLHHQSEVKEPFTICTYDNPP